MSLYDKSELEDWIKQHGGERNFKAFMNCAARKKRSFLSNHVYKESCKDMALVLKGTIENKSDIKEAATRQSQTTETVATKSIATKKKKSWFPCHYKLANLFKKPSLIHPLKLPTRYPIEIENTIHHISYLRLDNQKRPLQHHVVISNMLIQYISRIQQQNQSPYTSW